MGEKMENRKRAKAVSLSLRLDAKHKFALEFIARVRDQKLTTVVERAIKDLASTVLVESDGRAYRWLDYWDPHPGIRQVKLFALGGLETNYEEDERKAFIMTHRRFFLRETDAPSGPLVHEERTRVLWRRIDEFASRWEEGRSTEPYGVGVTMNEELRRARLAEVEWPPETRENTSSE